MEVIKSIMRVFKKPCRGCLESNFLNLYHNSVYYMVQVDDDKGLKGIESDMYFNLNDTIELNNYIDMLEKNKISFNCFIEEFNESDGNITGRFYLHTDL